MSRGGLRDASPDGKSPDLMPVCLRWWLRVLGVDAGCGEWVLWERRCERCVKAGIREVLSKE